jgi:hypothetical protein
MFVRTNAWGHWYWNSEFLCCSMSCYYCSLSAPLGIYLLLLVTGLIYLQDGALQLTESLFNGVQDFVKLDLSYCGLTSKYVLGLNSDLVYGILELNLEGNPIMLEVFCTVIHICVFLQLVLFCKRLICIAGVQRRIFLICYPS